MSTPATSTRGEFQNSLLGEITEEQDTNKNLSHSQSNTNENKSPILSTRGESFYSLLGESNSVSTTTTHPLHTNASLNQSQVNIKLEHKTNDKYPR